MEISKTTRVARNRSMAHVLRFNSGKNDRMGAQEQKVLRLGKTSSNLKRVSRGLRKIRVTLIRKPQQRSCGSCMSVLGATLHFLQIRTLWSIMLTAVQCAKHSLSSNASGCYPKSSSKKAAEFSPATAKSADGSSDSMRRLVCAVTAARRLSQGSRSQRIK